MKTTESTPEVAIAPHGRLNVQVQSGNIMLHLKKTDGIEMTYVLNGPGAYFNEDVSDYVSYQIIVNELSDYDIELA
ncbi:MAG: hypothetical protein V4580_03390 [Bacteroidota bacterium]